MAFKEIQIPSVGTVNIYKRKGAKTMRLSIAHDGTIRLTMPRWSPYSAGIMFINSHIEWIQGHSLNKQPLLVNSQRIGKAHRLLLLHDYSVKNITTRITETEVRVNVPIKLELDAEEVQSKATQAILRALKKESENLLTIRTQFLADKYDFTYNSIKYKQLKSRWGSCNNLKQITLSVYLIQLPWDLIDYVILHELTHTKHLSHNQAFWNELEKYIPEARKLKKEINTYKPVVYNNSDSSID